MISRCRSCGVFPRAVSRRFSAQLASSDSVKCKMQSLSSQGGRHVVLASSDMAQFGHRRKKAMTDS